MATGFEHAVKTLLRSAVLLASFLSYHPGAQAAGPWIFEAAPLQGLWGFPAVRFEAPLSQNFSTGIFYSTYRTNSQREDYQNRFQEAKGELIWRRQIFESASFSISAGAGYEQRNLGLLWTPPLNRTIPHQEAVGYQEQKNLGCLFQSVGIRFDLSSFWTLALKFSAEEFILKQSVISGAEPIDQPLNPRPTESTRFQFRLFTGVSL